MGCNFDVFALQDFNFKRIQLAKECFSLQLLSVLICLFLTPTCVSNTNRKSVRTLLL